MNNEKNFALLIDVDNLPLTADSVHSIINQVKAKGSIAYGKIYGYSEKKQLKGLMDIINKNGFDFTGKMRGKKSSKSIIDNRMFIDAVEIACINENIDSICIVAGDGDLVPLFAKLKELGIYVVGGFNDNPENADMCQEIVYIDGATGSVSARPAPVQSRPVAQTRPQTQFVPLRERMAQRNNIPYQPERREPVTRIGTAQDIDRAASLAQEKHPDMYNEIERMVQDFMKENEK